MRRRALGPSFLARRPCHEYRAALATMAAIAAGKRRSPSQRAALVAGRTCCRRSSRRYLSVTRQGVYRDRLRSERGTGTERGEGTKEPRLVPRSCGGGTGIRRSKLLGCSYSSGYSQLRDLSRTGRIGLLAPGPSRITGPSAPGPSHQGFRSSQETTTRVIARTVTRSLARSL